MAAGLLKYTRVELPASFQLAILVVIATSLPRDLECVALGAGVGAGNPGIGEEYEPAHSIFTAQVNVTYKKRDMPHSEIDDNCQFGVWSRIESEHGRLIAVGGEFCNTQPPTTSSSSIIPSPYERWILIMDGSVCRDFLYRALASWPSYHSSSSSSSSSTSSSSPSHSAMLVMKNASAIMVYGGDLGDMVPTTHVIKQREDPIIVLMSRSRGEHLSHLHGNVSRVDVRISVGAAKTRFFGQAINKTSMLFLSISFVVLMVISLAWLVFYYVQRSRYTHAKQRLSKRLMRAAKKAMGKMPLKTIYSKEDVETECDVCAICIEGYKTSDVVRILPCHHVFHKPCIDPWLVEQRSCPICKIDILKAFGMQVTKGHHHTQLDVDAPSSSLMDLPPLSSSLVGNESTISNSAQREFDSDGVEIVRFHQVAQVEHHRPSASWSSSGGEEGVSSAGCTISLTPQHLHHLRQSTDLVTASKSSAHMSSSESNSSGSAALEEEVFCYDGRCRQKHVQQQQQQQQQSLSSKHSGGSSASVPASSCGSTNHGEARRLSTRAGHASLECLDDPSNSAQDVFLPPTSSRPPFVTPSLAGDRAQASASELEPLSAGCCPDEDYERIYSRGAGVMLTKFPMETGL